MKKIRVTALMIAFAFWSYSSLAIESTPAKPKTPRAPASLEEYDGISSELRSSLALLRAKVSIFESRYAQLEGRINKIREQRLSESVRQSTQSIDTASRELFLREGEEILLKDGFVFSGKLYYLDLSGSKLNLAETNIDSTLKGIRSFGGDVFNVRAIQHGRKIHVFAIGTSQRIYYSSVDEAGNISAWKDTGGFTSRPLQRVSVNGGCVELAVIAQSSNTVVTYDLCSQSWR